MLPVREYSAGFGGIVRSGIQNDHGKGAKLVIPEVEGLIPLFSNT